MSQENLSAKFDEVKAELQAMNTALGSIGTKLDSVVNAIWGLRGIDERTLTDLYDKPVTLEGNVTIDVTGVEQRLDQVKAALIGAGSDPTDIRQAIWNLAGPAPGVNLVQLYNLLESGLITQTTPQIPYLLQLRNTLGTPPATNEESVQQLLANLGDTFGDRGAGLTAYNLLDALYLELLNVYQAIGVPTGDASTTVLGRLLAIANCACSTAEALNPSGPGASECITPYMSSGSVAGSGDYSGRTIAVWETLPDGLQYGNGNSSLKPQGTATWDGWQVYVTSTAPYFRRDSGTSLFPTNTWVTLPDTDDIFIFNVEGGHTLDVSLCAERLITDCITCDSELLQSSRWGFSYHMIVFPPVSGFIRGTTMATDPTDSYAGYVSLEGNFTGWTINGYKTGDVPYSPQWLLSNVTRNPTTGELTGQGKITANHSGNAGDQQPFYIKLCPPQ